jgi:pectate lyase
MKRILCLLAVLVPFSLVSCDEEPLTPPEQVETPEEPENPDTPENPEEPETPEDPEDPETPEEPELPVTGTVELDKLYGYAEGTTGGEGGKVHHFNDGKKFRDWLKQREKNKSTEPAVVWLSGTFTKEDGRDSGSPWFDIKRTHNLTILGTDGFRMQNVGFFLNEASNIIIRNVYIVQPKADNGADGISMQESHNVWVDHCTFESVNQEKDYEDGSCDVTHETFNVTVSWCHFIKTQKSCLVGHSNSASADEKITVTFHHNCFDLSNSRHPRVRFGRAHVYNNYFNQCSTYGVGSAYGARVLVEFNLFDGVRLPIDICTYPAKKSGSSWVSNLTGSVAGYVYERENEYLNRPSDATDPYPFTNIEYISYNGEKLAAPLTFEDFKPSYEYTVDQTADLATIVPSSSGVGKLQGYASAPVEVDNGGLGNSDNGSGDSGGTGDDNGSTDSPSEDLGNGWKSVACGGKTSTASVSGGKLTMTAAGKFESSAQSFGYVYREVAGDFTATVKVDSFTAAKESNQGLAGILLTPDMTKTGTDFLHAMSGRSQGAYYYSFRLETGAKASKGAMPAASGTGDTVLKLRREGEACYVSYSLDGGASFGNEKKNTIAGLPDTVYVGLAVNSANNENTGTAVFSSFTIDGIQMSF